MIDIVCGIFFMGFSFIVLFLIKDFPTSTVLQGMGPRFMPGLFSIVLGSLSVILLISGILSKKRNVSAAENGKIFIFENLKAPAFLSLIIFIYLVLLKAIGFLITTPFLVFAIMKIMGAKNRISLLTAIIITAILYVVFSTVLNVPLPSL